MRKTELMGKRVRSDGIEGQNEEASKPGDRERVILVIGAGDATGGAVAKKFASEGYTACLVRRDASKLEQLAQDITQNGGKAHVFGVDARKEGISFCEFFMSKP